jgi:integrase
MRKSNGKWYIRFEVDGVEYSRPTGLEATERNRRKATQMEAQARQLVIEGKSHYLRIQSIPFGDAATQFLSWAEGEYGEKRGTYLRIRSSFGFARQFFDRATVSGITEGDLEDFKAARRKMEVKEISIRHDLHALSVFFQYAVKKHWTRENIVRKVEIPSDADAVRMNVLTPEQERIYFETCLWMDKASRFAPSMNDACAESYSDLYDFGRLMIQQGCRPEELLELEKRNVDLMNSWLYVANGKTKAARRRLKLTGESASILVRRIQSVPGQFVFPSPQDPQRHRGPTWRVHGEVLEAARGKTPLSFVIYDLRHTFATRAAADGMPLATLAAILGHSRNSLRCVMKYVHVDAGSIDAETIRIDRIRAERMLSERAKSFAGFLPVTPSGEGENEVKGVKASEN